MLIKLTVKYFNLNFQAFFIVTGKLRYTWQVALHKDFIYSVACSTVERIIS